MHRSARVEFVPRRVGASPVVQLRLLGSRRAGVGGGLRGSDLPCGVGRDRLAPGCGVAKLSAKAIIKRLGPRRQAATSQFGDFGLLLRVQPLSFSAKLRAALPVAIPLTPDLCVGSLPLALP